MAEALSPSAGRFTLGGNVEVLDKPGAVRLDHVKYRHLVYAPIQHGPGIRTEDNGTPVAEICEEIAVNPDLAAVAAKFGTTVEHVRQAVAYGLEAHVLEHAPTTTT